VSKPTVDAEADAARRRSLITGAAGYALGHPTLEIGAAVRDYMRGQGLRRSTWAAWSSIQQGAFIHRVRRKVDEYNRGKDDPPPA
jgi:hypothetical protein